MNESYYAGTSYGVSTTSGLTGAIATMVLFFLVLFMALSILMFISLWKIFKKAGKPGWASIVPIYNVYIMCEIAEKEWWYVLLSCVPFANIYAMIVLYNGMAKRFGKSGGFVAGMLLLPVVFFPMLAFGKDAAIVNNQPNTSNENNMTDNTLGANAAAVPNMNGQTMTSNEMVTPNNPVMSEPVMSNPVGNVPFGNTSVESGLNSQNNESVQKNCYRLLRVTCGRRCVRHVRLSCGFPDSSCHYQCRAGSIRLGADERTLRNQTAGRKP